MICAQAAPALDFKKPNFDDPTTALHLSYNAHFRLASMDNRNNAVEARGSSVSGADGRGNGGGDNRRTGRIVGFLASLRTMLSGTRDPESDLSVEMLEELHMVTGCEF